MTKSLQDQLLELGLASKRPAKTAKKKKPRSAGKRSGRTATEQSKAATRRRPANKNKVADADNPSLEQAYRLRKKAETSEIEEARRRKREEDRKRRKLNQAIRAVVEPHRLNEANAEIARYFMYKERIRKVNVTAEQRDQLNSGDLGVVYLSGAYHLLAPDHVAQVRQISVEHVPDLTVDTGDQTDDGVPDDLMW